MQQQRLSEEPAELRLASGVAIPRVIMGTASLGSVLPDALQPSSDRKRDLRLLDGVLEAGCPAFDLAASYKLGGTERLVGEWLGTRRNREQVFLISKGGHPYPIVGPNRLTPSEIADDLHASLRRLKSDFIDLYLLHRDNPKASLEAIAKTLDGFQRSGKIRAWGLSNWTHGRIEEVDAIARRLGLVAATASSPHFSLFDWVVAPWDGCVSIAGAHHEDSRAFYERMQMPVLAYAPLGSGFLAERAGNGATRAYRSAENAERKARTERLARERKVTSAQVALAYLFNQSFPVYAIVAVSSVTNMRANLEATSLQIGKDSLVWLESGEAVDP